MAIERIIMAEGSISPDLSSPVVDSPPIPESGIQSAEPNVVVAQEQTGNRFSRLFRRNKSPMQVLVDRDEIVKNASLPDQERFEKVEQLLGAPLVSEQKEGILKAHTVGSGEDEVGIDGGKPGVFNYTREQIAHKARILNEAGLGKEQRRSLIESGLVGVLADSLEREASAERGEEIAEEIIKWEVFKSSGEYGKVDWKRLDDLYQQQRIHLEAIRIFSLRLEDVSPVVKQPKGPTEEPFKLDVSTLKDSEGVDVPSAMDLLRDYLDEDNTDLVKTREGANILFNAARQAGLLDEIDKLLDDFYNKEVVSGIGRGLSISEITSPMESRSVGLDQRLAVAIRSTTELFRSKRNEGIDLSRLSGVWNLYAQFAQDRIASAIRNKDEEWKIRPEDLSDEFRPNRLSGGDEEDTFLRISSEPPKTHEETYWKTSMGYYVEVLAKTEGEFGIAVDSYINRLRAITAAPQKLFQEVESFVSILYKSDGAKLVSTDFLNKLVMRAEARLGVFGADHSNELYHGDFYKQYLDYINKDGKGPDRWLELFKSKDGLIAASLWMLDKDPRWEILFSLYGARGQLADASYAQRTGMGSQGLFVQAKDLLLDELLGVRLTEFDPNHKDKVMRNLTRFTSDKNFTGMFEGLNIYKPNHNPDNDPNIKPQQFGDANIKFYEANENVKDEDLTVEQRRIKKLGRIQKNIRSKERGGLGHSFEHLLEEAKGKLESAQKSKNEEGIKQAKEKIKGIHSDEKFYEEQIEKIEKIFEQAWEIYGTMGEKSKRAGGVFTVQREFNGEKFQDFVPIHYAEKFVTFAETMTKIKYRDDADFWKDRSGWDPAIIAEVIKENRKQKRLDNDNFKALYRFFMVEKARNSAIAGFKKDGFQAKLYDENNNQILLKRPKRGADGEIERVNGKAVVEEYPVDFYTATHHPYGDWTSHTYWSYQEEDRHMILAPATFQNARKIRDGELDPLDLTDPWAIQLLILDPTLQRVRRLSGKGKHWEERERKLTMAAVEDSYQSHWRVSRELHRAFWSADGTPKDINIYYGLQDYGGYTKMLQSFRAQAAEDPERFMRRGRRLLPDLHIPSSSLPEIWGQGSQGALGVFRMFATPVYRMAGSIALDKASSQIEVAGKLHSSLFNGKDNNEAEIIEGLLLKLTNDADARLQRFGMTKVPKEGDWSKSDPGVQMEFMSAIRESFGRLEKYVKKLVVMETLIRNANGAQWLEKIDIQTGGVGKLPDDLAKALDALPDISKEDLKIDELAEVIKTLDKVDEATLEDFSKNFNEGTDEKSGIDEGNISTNTGSGRHSARIFFDTFIKFIIDESKRGGAKMYPGEKFIMKHLMDKVIVLDKNEEYGVRVTNDTIADWLFGKFVAT